MVPEAPLERGQHGTAPAGEGWFVLNARDARWFENEDLGRFTQFQGENVSFDQLGIGLGIIHPGQPNAMYHAEEAQEDFLVLSGECRLLIEGEERHLRAWDFVHCPQWTEHVFVGAGDGPCLVLAVGARRKGRGLVYPVSELALRYGAGVETETSVPSEAYARFSKDAPIPCPPEFPFP